MSIESYWRTWKDHEIDGSDDAIDTPDAFYFSLIFKWFGIYFNIQFFPLHWWSKHLLIKPQTYSTPYVKAWDCILWGGSFHIQSSLTRYLKYPRS